MTRLPLPAQPGDRLAATRPLWPTPGRALRWLLMAGASACATAPEPLLIALPPTTVVADRAPMAAVDAADPARAARGNSPAAPVLLVHRLTIPEYMMARRVRYWAGPATLADWPNAWWAERIEIGMARTLLAALRERLPGWAVCDGRCSGGGAQHTLKVELLRLDARRQDLQLSASVHQEVMLAAGPTQPGRVCETPPRAFTVRWPADSPQGEATALRSLLLLVADAAASELLAAGERPDCRPVGPPAPASN